MLKKLIIGIIMVNFVFMLVGVLTTIERTDNGIAVAANTATFGVGATVPSYLEINAILRTVAYNATTSSYDIDWSSSPGSSLDFGTLVEVNDGQGKFAYMAGANAYAVVMYPTTSGRAYTIVETGGVLQNAGGATIPSAAYVMTPDYQQLDTLGDVAQGAMPAGASLTAPQSAVGTHTVYTSDTNGSTKAIRVFLAITGPDSSGNIMNYSQGHNAGTGVGTAQYYQQGDVGSWQPVTRDQASGSYSGSVTFTVNLQ